MRWDQGHESPDVVDRRGQRPGVSMGGFLPFLPLLLRSRFGWVGLLALGVYYVYTRMGSPTGASQSLHPTDATHPTSSSDADGKMVHFVSFVLDDVQATWSKDFAARGLPYRHAKLVLFTGATRTGCGAGQAASGPFYCPADEQVYIDLSFYRELSQKFGAKGDFAQAYVIAHELGHHVQNLLGISEKVHGTRGDNGANGASVRLELQADCLAGIWAHSTEQRQILETGDLQEALQAAAAIGDDRLQKQATGTISPESWTHGSSQQRSRWLDTGSKSSKLESCDTFRAASL